MAYFESWEMQRQLGSGAFGEVILVRTNRGHQLAAKYIQLPSSQVSPEYIGGYRRPYAVVQTVNIPAEVAHEIAILKRLSHPNVVQFVDVMRHGDCLVVFTEFINGRELATLGRLSEATAIEYLGQICSGLNYLHTCNPPVLHRDIKGQNIMVALDGTVKLIDFGISMNMMVASGINATQVIMTTDNACGTLPFMAPELFAVRCQFSVKSDVWALGMTIYQMVAGESPFSDARSFEDLVRRIRTSGAPPLPAGCSRKLTNFYACCTAMDPEARMSVRQLLEHRLFTAARSGRRSCSVL